MKRSFITPLFLLSALALGWFLGEPVHSRNPLASKPVGPPPSILPTSRLIPPKPWLDELTAFMNSWPRLRSPLSFRQHYDNILQQRLPIRSGALARLLTEWHTFDKKDLITFTMERIDSAPTELQQEIRNTILQLAYRADPTVAIPLAATTRQLNAWLMHAAHGDSATMRNLIVEYGLASSNSDPLLVFANPEAALKQALSENAPIDAILIIWAQRDPFTAWKKATAQHVADDILERLFFTWATQDPADAFRHRDEIIATLASSEDAPNNSARVHEAIARRWGPMHADQALAAAASLEPGGPLESFLKGFIATAPFPGLPLLDPVMARIKPPHETREAVLEWIADHVPQQEALAWASAEDAIILAPIYTTKDQAPESESSHAEIAAALWANDEDPAPFHQHFQKWLQTDASAARQWVSDQDDPRLLDAWRTAQVAALVASPGGTPRSAYELSSQIDDPQARSAAMQAALRQWIQANPQEAAESIAEAPIHEQDRESLRLMANSKLELMQAIDHALGTTPSIK